MVPLQYFDHHYPAARKPCHQANHSFLPSGSGELEFEEFCALAAKFLIEEDEEALHKELKEAFRIYDKHG